MAGYKKFEPPSLGANRPSDCLYIFANELDIIGNTFEFEFLLMGFILNRDKPLVSEYY